MRLKLPLMRSRTTTRRELKRSISSAASVLPTLIRSCWYSKAKNQAKTNKQDLAQMRSEFEQNYSQNDRRSDAATETEHLDWNWWLLPPSSLPPLFSSLMCRSIRKKGSVCAGSFHPRVGFVLPSPSAIKTTPQPPFLSTFKRFCPHFYIVWLWSNGSSWFTV